MHLTSDAEIKRRAKDVPASYVVFDVLYLDGELLVELPLSERRERLESLKLEGPSWQTPAIHMGDGEALLEASAAQGLEGVVAKRLDSPYEPGRRSSSLDQGEEQAAPGARGRRLDGGRGPAGQGPRRAAGRPLRGRQAALRRPRRHRLHATRRCATWRSGSRRSRARPRRSRRGRSRPKGANWVEPRLVAEVEFTEWTREGILRHPSYKGLRDDKDPREVVREDTQAAQESKPAPKPASARRRARRGSTRDAPLFEAVNGAAARGARGGRRRAHAASSPTTTRSCSRRPASPRAT